MKLDEFLALSDKEKNNLKELCLSNNNISNLDLIFNEDTLQNLKNLDYLNLGYNNITDISLLQYLTSLKYLFLNNNNITDILPLKNLTNLENLYLGDNNITDISPLKNLTKLRNLILYLNNIIDISPLKNLTECDISLSYFPFIYNNNPDHPLVMSYKLKEFDIKMKKQLFDDLEIEIPIIENNISYYP